MIDRPRRTKLSLATIAMVAACLLAVGLTNTESALAHGYVGSSGPGIIARAADPVNADRGAIAHEPQSLEAPNGFPASGPADGQLASAGLAIAANLDEQSATRWNKHTVTTGELIVPWHFTAPHKTSRWSYYLTTQGWDQNAPLDRGDFELIAEILHNGSAASANPSHVIDVPTDRSGYHVLYAVWDIADTPNAFYNVIDLNVVGNGTPAPVPTTAVAAPTTAAPVPTTVSPAPPSTTPVSGIPAWSATGSYQVGDVVTHRGATYRCIQSYRGHGDPNWIHAPSLWVRR